MSNFPSIEEFDSGRVTATRIEDVNDDADLLDSAQKDFLAREQAILGEDAQFFQTEGLTGSQPTQGEAEFYGANDCISFYKLALVTFRQRCTRV